MSDTPITPILSGRKIVVTGGGRGIGFGLCHALDKAGAEVLAVSREFDPKGFDNTRIKSLTLDLMEEGAVETILTSAIDTMGHVDGLVNNAATMVKDRLQLLDRGDFQRVLALNVEFVQALSSHFARYWIEAEHKASIVNISSFLAHRHMNGSAAYRASKVALESLTESMALEWGRFDIRTNAIAPGWVKTPMTETLLDGAVGRVFQSQNPMRRLGEIEDLTPIIAFLLSSQAGYINGATIAVDGGQRLA